MHIALTRNVENKNNNNDKKINITISSVTLQYFINLYNIFLVIYNRSR